MKKIIFSFIILFFANVTLAYPVGYTVCPDVNCQYISRNCNGTERLEWDQRNSIKQYKELERFCLANIGIAPFLA